jgi:hypothetical protein
MLGWTLPEVLQDMLLFVALPLFAAERQKLLFAFAFPRWDIPK